MPTPIFSQSLMEQLDQTTLTFIQKTLDGHIEHACTISAFFDATGLPCPMPLLKAKIALRGVADGDSLYLLASDKNSQTDLVAFCKKQGFEVITWHSTPNDDHNQHNAANYFHFIITKKASNSHI